MELCGFRLSRWVLIFCSSAELWRCVEGYGICLWRVHVWSSSLTQSTLLQKEITVKSSHNPPILLVPLRFPIEESNPLTAWTTVSIDLSFMIRHFQSATSDVLDTPNEPVEPGESRQRPAQSHARRFPLPNSRYASTDYLQIYANCRLRRVWFSEDRPSSSLPWEFQLYGTATQ